MKSLTGLRKRIISKGLAVAPWSGALASLLLTLRVMLARGRWARLCSDVQGGGVEFSEGRIEARDKWKELEFRRFGVVFFILFISEVDLQILFNSIISVHVRFLRVDVEWGWYGADYEGWEDIFLTGVWRAYDMTKTFFRWARIWFCSCAGYRDFTGLTIGILGVIWNSAESWNLLRIWKMLDI